MFATNHGADIRNSRGGRLAVFRPENAGGRSPERAAIVVAALVLACSTAEVTGPNESIETILVAPPTATVAVGATLSLEAEVRTATGDVIGSQRVAWSSEDVAIAEVSSNGVVTGLKVGTVLIAASARGHDAFARVTVNPRRWPRCNCPRRTSHCWSGR
jgi:hypothetical protein